MSTTIISQCKSFLLEINFIEIERNRNPIDKYSWKIKLARFNTWPQQNLQGINDLIFFVKSDPRVTNEGSVFVFQFQFQISGSTVLQIAESFLRNTQSETIFFHFKGCVQPRASNDTLVSLFLLQTLNTVNV